MAQPTPTLPADDLKSEGFFRSLFENMLNGVAYCQMIFENGRPVDFIYLAVNKRFEELTGLKDVVGKKVTELIPGIQQTNAELLETYGRVATTGKPERFDLDFRPLRLYLDISVYCPQKGYFVAVFDNKTTLKKTVDELRKQNAEMEKIIRLIVNRELKLVELKKELAKAQ